MKTLKIDLYSEISCPWCLIALRRLDNVLARDCEGVEVDIEHHPVILQPDCPPQGLRIADLLLSRYGITDPAAAWVRPHAEARSAGLELDLGRQPFTYPTLAAHTLIRLARPLGSQHQLAVAVSEAYFLAARNIGDVDVLADIAASFGFDHQQAMRLARDPLQLAATEDAVSRAFERGIRSVPHFIINNGVVLSGSPTEQALAEAIKLPPPD
ncbi:MAG: polyketide synthase [Gammaproteobacteria bacterium BRH_c0]|nr:MAG: polyketide synthase [Gammaproteobacteria bacterium BRH_c0]